MKKTAQSKPAQRIPLVHLHEDDIERIVAAVLAALKRERFIDDIARELKDRLRKSAGE
jgi:hypothetical protein